MRLSLFTHLRIAHPQIWLWLTVLLLVATMKSTAFASLSLVGYVYGHGYMLTPSSRTRLGNEVCIIESHYAHLIVSMMTQG